MSLENPEQSKKFLSILDWTNELLQASKLAEQSLSDEEWLKIINSDYYKETFHLKTLDERFQTKHEQVIDDEFYINHSEIKSDQDKKAFFDKKNKLDELVNEFNEEIKKSTPSRENIQVLYKKMFAMLR